jgi:hypothetical protein
MLNKLVMRTMLAAVIFGTVILLLGYAHQRLDPFFQYKNFTHKPLSIEPKQLKYYAEEEQLIRTKLKLELSQRERVILAGLHWLISFIDKDKNFDYLFPDFMLLMHNMTISDNRLHQQEVAQLIVKKSFVRAENKLSKLFRTDDDSRFEFVRLFHILVDYPEVQSSYFRFYQEYFESSLGSSYQADGTEFTQAIKQANYQVLFAYLVQTSFLHYYLAKVKNPSLRLPPNEFPKHLKEFENFNYALDQPLDYVQLRDLGYLVTHVVLVLTNYGEFAIREGSNRRKAQDYIDLSLEKVRYQLGDFDLLAEYIQCLKILKPKEDLRINDLENFLFDLQRPDGSWGSKRDFETNPYTAIHPSGAALMALNQSNYHRRKEAPSLP